MYCIRGGAFSAAVAPPEASINKPSKQNFLDSLRSLHDHTFGNMDRNYEKHCNDDTRPISITSNGEKRKRVPGTPGRKQYSSEDILWTAARCNRHLRSIISKLQALRRLSENNFADKAFAKRSPARRKINFNPESTTSEKIPSVGVQSLSSKLAALPDLESPTKDDNDPEWLPEDGRRPSQKTYAGRGGKAKKVKLQEPSRPASSTDNPDSQFRSPFIKRLLSADAAKSPTNPITGTPRRLTSQKIVTDPKTEPEKVLRMLLDSLSKVLSVTSANPEVSPWEPCRPITGARSLRNMCLRKAPEYIAYEQKYAYDRKDYEFDATETIYVEVERILVAETSDGLREMLRAHAVKLIVDAFDDRSWPVESLDRLLDVCERNRAVAEGQQVLRSWFIKAEGRVSNRMARLMAWSKILRCPGWFFQTICGTLEAGQVSWEEVNSCPGIWQELLKAMARTSTMVDAAAFLEAYTVICLRFEDSAVEGVPTVPLHQRLRRDEILRNVMALVTAVSWTSNEQPAEGLGPTICLASLIHRTFINVLQTSIKRCEQITHISYLSRDALRTMEPLLTSGLILYALHSFRAPDSPDSLQPDPIEARLNSVLLPILQDSGQQALQSDRAELICSAAKCIAHLSQQSANEFIQDLSTSVLLLGTSSSRELNKTFNQLAVLTAASWAEYRGDKASYTFADEIERAAHRGTLSGHLQHTPGSAQRPQQTLRWEEAIREWIVATPLAIEQEIEQARRLKEYSSNEGKKIEVPIGFRSYPYRLQCRDRTSLDPDISEAIRVARVKERFERPSPHSAIRDNSSRRLNSDTNSEGPEYGDECLDSSTSLARPPRTPSVPASTTNQDDLVHTQPSASPLKIKSFQHVQPEPSQGRALDRDQLLATPSGMASKPGLARVRDDLRTPCTPTTLPPTDGHASFSSPLAIRTRPPIPHHTENRGYAERDELAMTPAQPAQRSTPKDAMEVNHSDPLPVNSQPEERDELAATPAKPVLQSTRVLRSAMKKSAHPLGETIQVGLSDELAMTPLRRPGRQRKKTLPDMPLAPEGTERDELGTTPQVPRTQRSRQKQLSRTKSRSKSQSVKAGMDEKAVEKQVKMPLGARSGNIKTASKDDTAKYSDDELGV